jgi:hypothetical protein
MLTILARNGVPLPVARWNVACVHAYQEHTDHTTKTSIRSAHEQFRLRTRSLRRYHIKDVVIFITHRSLGNLCSPEFVRKLEDPDGWNQVGHRRLPARENGSECLLHPHPIKYHKVCGIVVCLASSAIGDHAG